MALTKPTGAMLNAGATSAPQALGIAAAGTSQSYSRADHVHAMPSAGDVGAIPTSQLASLASLTGGHLTTSQIPALGGDITLAAGAVSAQVVALQGSAIAATAPASGQVLAWNGTQWAPSTASTGGGGGANGLTYYLNQGTAADAPTTNIPATPHQLGRTGETGQTTVTTGTLTQNTWVLVAGFVSESAPVDPATTTIPAGLWDFNLWAYGNANAQAGTSIRALAYIYNGTTLTLLGTSGGQVINGTSAQYSLSVLVQQTTVSLTDRIYIAIEAYATGNNHNVTAQFGDGTPSHVHTSLPLVGGTGLWKNSSGVLQSPASLLVDADVDAAANIAYSKLSGVQSALSSAAPLALIAGGTGATTAVAALTALGAQPALTTAAPLALTLGGTGASDAGAALFNLGSPTHQAACRTTSNILPTTVAGTFTTAGWVTGATTITLTVGNTASLAIGMVLGTNGLLNSSILALPNSSTITLSSPATSTVAVSTNLVIYNTTATTMTIAATGVQVFEGQTVAVNDVVAFTNQSALTLMGPWVCTTAGAVGVQPVYARPSWFTGTSASPVLLHIAKGISIGQVYSIFPTLAAAVDVGFVAISAALVGQRTTTATLGTNIFGASTTQTFAAGTITTAPIKFQAGVVLTTPLAHAVEWDGTSMYLTTSALARTTNVVATAIPATAGAAGVAGQIAVDNTGSWLYVCTATNVWKRVLLTTF